MTFHILTVTDLCKIAAEYGLEEPQPLVFDGFVGLLHRLDDDLPQRLTQAVADHILGNEADGVLEDILIDIAPHTVSEWDVDHADRNLTYWPNVTLLNEYPAGEL